ncbi:MAG: porin family protein [Bacteroidota bacterium]
MRKVLITAMAVLLVGASQAQIFTVGPKVGVSSSNLSVADNVTDFQNGERKFGFHAGVMTRITLGNLYVQPEALYTNASGQLIDFSDPSVVGGQVVDYTFNRFDVPVLLGYKLGPFRAFAGGVWSGIISASELRTVAGEGTKEDITELYDSGAWGYQAGVGVDLGKLTMDLKYEGSLGRYGALINDAAGNPVTLDQRASQLMLSVGYMLF